MASTLANLRPISRMDGRRFMMVSAPTWVRSSSTLANPELLALQLPALRADLLVSMAHDRLPAPVGAPLLLLRGSEDHTVDAAGMDAWRPVSTGAVQRREYPGGHHPLAENRHRLLEDLEACADPGRSR